MSVADGGSARSNCLLHDDLGARAVQGLVAGAGMIVGRTVVRDLFDGPVAQRFMSNISMIFAIAPALAPIVGGVGDAPRDLWRRGR